MTTSVNNELRVQATDALLEDYEFLRANGLSRDQAADRLQVTRTYLDKVLQRAGRRGDPRSDWVPTLRRGHEREAARTWTDERVSSLRVAYQRELRAGRVPSDAQVAAAAEYDVRLRVRQKAAS